MELIEKIETWLSEPDLTDLESAKLTLEELSSSALELMRSNPELNAELGPLIGRLKGLHKQLTNIEPIHWVQINEGHLALGHRPSAKLVQDLKLQGATHIFTLLSESEEANKYKILANKSDMGWIWFPMTSAQAPHETRSEELKETFVSLRTALQNNGKVYVHCSAGIHRTGMITYTLLRYMGFSESQTGNLLAELRTETAEGVGEQRITWAEEMLAHLI